jgi:hypothetical protein
MTIKATSSFMELNRAYHLLVQGRDITATGHLVTTSPLTCERMRPTQSGLSL